MNPGRMNENFIYNTAKTFQQCVEKSDMYTKQFSINWFQNLPCGSPMHKTNK